MGQVIVEFAKGPASSAQGPLQILEYQAAKVQELATSGTHQRTAITAPFANTAAVIHNNSSTLVWVAFGETPTASVPNVSTDVTTAMRPVMPNSSFTFGGIPKGWKASVIDDS